MIAGLFIVIARGNLIKKLVGLGIFQTSVYLLYIAPGKLIGGTAPIVSDAFTVYSNPLPHVLILTAIVVGVATLALGLALVVRIREAYDSIEEDDISRQRRGDARTAMSIAATCPRCRSSSRWSRRRSPCCCAGRRAAFAVALAAAGPRLRSPIALLAAGADSRARSRTTSAAGRRRGASSTGSTG